MARELVIYCDESISKGRHFSNFYGGVIIRSSDLEPVQASIAAKKAELGFSGEVKWQKVSWDWQNRYIALVDHFFDLIETKRIKVRIMFSQNIRIAQNLTKEQIENSYFLLYYQFLKHAFGLPYCNPDPAASPINVRIYLDQLPDTAEKANRFKAYLAALTMSPPFRRARVVIQPQNVTDVVSHNHDILQCLDIVLGSMQFRLNDLHKEKPDGSRVRGKRTRAKEQVYSHINRRLQKLRPNFNIGISTGEDGDAANRWRHPYRHWLFAQRGHKVDTQRSKSSSKK